MTAQTNIRSRPEKAELRVKRKPAPGDVVLVIESPNVQPRPKKKGRPKSPPQFVVKAADGGYGVFLSLPKPEGKQTRSKDTRENRYCCFLTPAEFEQARGCDFPAMADFTLAKIERRKITERTDPAKLAAIAATIEGLIPPHQLAATGD